MSRGVIISIVVGVALFFGLMVFIFSRGSKEEVISTDPQTLNIWIPTNNINEYKEASAKFLESNPSIKLNYRYVEAKDAADYEAQVVNAIANGAGPDVWLIRSDWLPKHVSKSLPLVLKDADPIVANQELIGKNLSDLGVYKGKLYGIPVIYDTLALIINSKLRSQLLDGMNRDDQRKYELYPKTWAELSDFATKFTTRNGDKISISGLAIGTLDNTYASTDIINGMMLQNGAEIINDSDEVVLNVSKGTGDSIYFPSVGALSYYSGFSKSDGSRYTWSRESGDVLTQFKADKVLSFIGYYSTVKQLLDDNESMRLQVVTLPQPLEVKPEERKDYLIGWLMIVNSATAKSDMAWNYLSFLNSDDARNVFENKFNKLSYPPTGRVKDLGYSVSGTSSIELFRTQALTGKQLIKPEWQRSDQIIQDMIRETTELNQSAQTAVDSATAKFKLMAQQ